MIIHTQIHCFEHVILANTTNKIIAELSEKLCTLKPWLRHALYASDGSCAVEIALKMSLHSRKITGEAHRTQYIALSNGYHGETTGALSVSDISIYTSAYADILFDCYFIKDIPYVCGESDPLWHNCEKQWNMIEPQLAPLAETATAIILEPILQGAGGMKIYSPDFLKRLGAWAKKHNVHLIADEIMTGFGRAGKTFAFEYANVQPDFVCIAKGLTAGWLPMSVTLTTHEMYQHFYQDYESGHNFLHSHTHSGNALAASVALTVLAILEKEKINQKACTLGNYMLAKMQSIATELPLKNIRQVGALVAADLITPDKKQRYGYQVYQAAIKAGALLRPLGNTIYWAPPLNIDVETIDILSCITQQAIKNQDIKKCKTIFNKQL